MANIYCTVPICHIIKSQQVFSHLIFMTQCQIFTNEEAEAEIDSETRSKSTTFGIPVMEPGCKSMLFGTYAPLLILFFSKFKTYLRLTGGRDEFGTIVVGFIEEVKLRRPIRK